MALEAFPGCLWHILCGALWQHWGGSSQCWSWGTALPAGHQGSATAGQSSWSSQPSALQKMSNSSACQRHTPSQRGSFSTGVSPLKPHSTKEKGKLLLGLHVDKGVQRILIKERSSVFHFRHEQHYICPRVRHLGSWHLRLDSVKLKMLVNSRNSKPQSSGIK